MSQQQLPKIEKTKDSPLPPFIMTTEKGSFARKSIEERKPQIIDQILAYNDFKPEIQQSLLDFKDELSSGPIQPLHENTLDQPAWDQDLQPWLGKSWLEIPWFFAEAYFYRRILEVTHYFQPGPYMIVDPFEYLKTKEMLTELSRFADIYPTLDRKGYFLNFRELSIKALWGNRGDLSFVKGLDPSMETQSHRIILDHTENAYQYIESIRSAKIVYFFDNVGRELYFDLALVDYLLQNELAVKITCYLKSQPFFVSDAMPKDFLNTVKWMSNSEVLEITQLVDRLMGYVKSGQMQIEAPPFFTTGRMFNQMPPILQGEIAAHDFAILKGDANYRRLIGDRHWEPTTPINIPSEYFPTTYFSLRTLKSELIVGLSQEILNKVLKESDPDWLINGKRGMITFLQK